MSLSPNTTLAHYTIISKIGAGGMGEIYRARDTRLDREVAIKLLPAEVSSDSDRLGRKPQVTSVELTKPAYTPPFPKVNGTTGDSVTQPHQDLRLI